MTQHPSPGRVVSLAEYRTSRPPVTEPPHPSPNAPAAVASLAQRRAENALARIENGMADLKDRLHRIAALAGIEDAA
ncbi:MAG: hypothetical protein JWM87_747 [Candidatus Eremiobacteraeota bacterium]|nr:hypothetical protein [Candidatus Eremiobacteraeota bacterium]